MRSLLAVLGGGVAGTALRLGVDVLVPIEWATLIVNVVGAFALGLLVAWAWPRVPDWIRAGLGAGLLGSFTTFSAVAVIAVAEPVWLGALYVIASLVLGVAAAFLGLRLGRRPAAPIDPVNE